MPRKLTPIREIHHYLEELYAPQDSSLVNAQQRAIAAGLKEIQVPPLVGKMLYMLAKLSGASRILEIGTLGGISTLWLAQALPKGGSLISLEREEAHALIAQQNIAEAGLSDKVDVRLGAALDLMPNLKGPFDFFFFDADRENYLAYLDWALDHATPGALIVTDNTVRNGKVIDPADPSMEVLAEYNRTVAYHPELESVVFPTFGGYAGQSLDGLTIARVREAVPQ